MLTGGGYPAGSQVVGKALSMRGHKKPDDEGTYSVWLWMVWGGTRGRKKAVKRYQVTISCTESLN